MISVNLWLKRKTALPNTDNWETRKIATADIDGDGDLDVFLANVQFIPTKDNTNRLLINDGRGFFEDQSRQRLPFVAEQTIDAIFEDIDRDGDPDLITAGVFGSPIRALINNDGVFSDETVAVFGKYYYRDALGVISEDLNGDGHRDLYICDRNTGSGNKDLLFIKQAPNSTDTHEKGQGMKIWPNPYSDMVNIRGEISPDMKFNILNLEGQVISWDLEVSHQPGLATINIPRAAPLPPVVYLQWESGDRLGGQLLLRLE